MLDKLTIDDFANLKTGFRIHTPDQALDAELVDRRELADADTGESRRRPFSIVFRGPMTPVLAQRIYDIEHSGLGRVPIFLVPVGPDGEGMRYEAVFN
jgi:hypothetical protein